MKRVVGITVLISLLALTISTTLGEEEIVFGKEILTDNRIESVDSNVYNLELRTVKEAKNISERLADKLEDAIVLFVDSPTAYVFGKIDRIDGVGGLNSFENGDQIKFEANDIGLTPIIVDNRTLVPVRFVSENLGAIVSWLKETSSARIIIDDMEIIFTLGKEEYTVNGVEKRLDVSPRIIKDRMSIPFRVLAEELGYNVFWDKSGIIAMSRNSLFDEHEDAELIKELEDSFYNATSADIQHPYKYRFTEMLDYSVRDNLRKFTLEELQSNLGKAYTLQDSDYLSELQTELSKQKFLDTPSVTVRTNTHRLASCYIKTGDDFYARRSIITMYQQALYYKDVPKELSNTHSAFQQMLFGQQKLIPSSCVNAYDILYYSDQWTQLSEELGVDVRAEVEEWFRETVLDTLSLIGGNYIQNTNGSCVPPALFTAIIINDAPLLHRAMYELEGVLFSGYEFHADGMWHEGSFGYHSDTIAKHLETLPLFVYYKDPIGYVDDVYGYSLDYTNGFDLFPLVRKALDVFNNRYFPNGNIVALNDTTAAINKDPDKEIKEQYLKNTELYHFGHYALTHGDTNDAQQVRLSFFPSSDGYPYSARHHYHYANLPIILWGGGMEVLPEIGYPTNSSMAQRVLRLLPSFHNASFIWDSDEIHTAEAGMFSRPSTIAYDGGENNGKKVQMIEASVLGPEHYQNSIEIKRRLLLMIETEGNCSYTFDLQRLKGGDVHENYLISGEDERTELKTSLDMIKHDGTLKELLKDDSVGYPNGRDSLMNPMTADGTIPFDFKWTGKESGTSVNIFMNGIEGSEVYFSEYPSYREAGNDKSKEFDFPGWHFYRRLKVKSSDVTKLATVYETTKKEQKQFVESVEWINVDADAPMCMAAVVDIGEYEDVIYISDDVVERNVMDITFAGSVAILRRNKETKEPVWGYIYGEGIIKLNDFEVKGMKTKRFKVLEATGGLSEESINYLKVRGSLSGYDYSNVWLRVKFPDKSGWALKIKDVDQSYIYTHQHPAFEVTDSGSNMLFYPRLEVESNNLMKIGLESDSPQLPLTDLRSQKQRSYKGDAWIEISVPIFVEK